MSDDERVLHGPGSSTEARARRAADDDIQERRRIATIDGSDVKDGEPFFDLPKWFTRTGRTRCEIDTGFGIVKMKTVLIEEDTLMRFAQGDGNAAKRMLMGLVSIPTDWEVEEDCVLERNLTLHEGDMVPQPREIATKNPKVCAKYVAEFMPRSLITQIVTAYQFMVMPPIAYTEMDPEL
jgi:hypothetical protein